MTDVEEIPFKKGSTSAPVFTVKKWVPRPECLKEEQPVEEDAVEEFADEF